MSFQSDWDGFFSNQVAAGQVIGLGNGASVTKMADGTAWYQDSSGASVRYDKNTDPNQVAQQAKVLGQQWGEAYGMNTTPAPAPAPAPAPTGLITYSPGKHSVSSQPGTAYGDYQNVYFNLDPVNLRHDPSKLSATSFTEDWNGFFSDQIKPGQVISLGQGGATVTKNADGTATYRDAGGTVVTYDRNSNPGEVGKMAPVLGEQWTQAYQTQTGSTNYEKRGQWQVDPAARGYSLNQNNTVTSQGVNPNAQAGDWGGDYTTRDSIDQIPNADAREYYKKNPVEFYALIATKTDPLVSYMQKFVDPNWGRPAGEWISGGGGGSSYGGSSSGGLGSSSGGSSSGGSSSGGSSSGGSATTRPVDAGQDTIEGRVQNLLAVDAQGNYKNALVQQAREAAERQFAGRGLLNSSIAQEAAMQAAISKAIEIAGPDAQTYFAQGRANQDTLNTFKRDEIANQNDMAKLDKQLALEREKLTVQGSQFNKELAYKYDALKLGQDSQIEAEQRAHQYALEIKNIDAVNAAYDLYLRRIQDIDMNKDLTAENKQKMKNDAGKDFDLYAKAKGISWQMGLGDRFSSTPQASQSAANDSAANGLLYSGGGGGA